MRLPDSGLARLQDEEEQDVTSPLMGPPKEPEPAWRRQQHRARIRRNLFPIMLVSCFIFVFYLLWHVTFGKPLPYAHAPKRALLVQLPGYGSFRGTQVLRRLDKDTTLDLPVDAWLGIDYAQQPVGEFRFAPPDWPAPFNGTKDAVEYGPSCEQNGNGAGQSEACLTFNLFRTPGVPFSKKLPVLVFFHGGSFVLGSGKSFDGASFVARSNEPLIVVTPNYRLSALGSLPSRLFEEEGLLNLDLLDQRLLLEFVQKYVGKFGGDAERVTLAGQSAGGHSAGIHLFHNYNDDKPLFSQAILSSGAPTARSFPDATCHLYQRQFSEFMEGVGCPMDNNTAAMECLRSADINRIRNKQWQIFRDSQYNITWPFQPVSPGPMLEKKGSTSGVDGTFHKVPLLISSCSDEGSSFAPKNLQSNADFRSFLANLNPGLTEKDLDDLENLYQDPEQPGSPYADSPQSTQFNRIKAAVGDYSYICPVQETAFRLARSGVPVYKARFNTPNWAQKWEGVPHASDGMYFNGAPNVQFPAISELYHSYWASFVVSGDPNKFAVENAPIWDVYNGLDDGQDGQLVVGSTDGSGTRMEKEVQGIRMDACAWWRDPERMARLHK